MNCIDGTDASKDETISFSSMDWSIQMSKQLEYTMEWISFFLFYYFCHSVLLLRLLFLLLNGKSAVFIVEQYTSISNIVWTLDDIEYGSSMVANYH